MEAAQGALDRTGVIVLHKPIGQPRCRIALRVIALEEKAACVRKDTRLDDYDAWKFGRENVHGSSAAGLGASPSRMTDRRYSPYAVPRSGAASRSTCWASMNPIRYATSSIAPTLRPCRCSTAATKFDAWIREAAVPVSSHATPRPSSVTVRRPLRRYARLTSVI